MFCRFGALGDDQAMLKREMNIRDLPKPLQYAAVRVLLVFVVVTPLNWIVSQTPFTNYCSFLRIETGQDFEMQAAQPRSLSTYHVLAF